MSITITKATKSDVQTILELTVALAEFEKKTPEQILVTREKLERWGFGPDKVFDAYIARKDDKAIGMAVCFFKYAGSVGEPIFYIEDLFVLPEERGKGYGKSLFKYLAGLALERDCCRMEWMVFDWNETAKNFYQSVGCIFRSDLIQVRLEGNELKELSKS